VDGFSGYLAKVEYLTLVGVETDRTGTSSEVGEDVIVTVIARGKNKDVVKVCQYQVPRAQHVLQSLNSIPDCEGEPEGAHWVPLAYSFGRPEG
jgi:hypothetical protein